MINHDVITISIVITARIGFHKHPWSIGGGGAAELKEQVDEAAKKMLEKDANTTKQLNLITCGSIYNTNTKTYEDRVLAVAEAI